MVMSVFRGGMGDTSGGQRQGASLGLQRGSELPLPSLQGRQGRNLTVLAGVADSQATISIPLLSLG